MLGSLGEHERKAPSLYRSNNIGTDHFIPSWSFSQSFIEPLKLNSSIGLGRIGRAEPGWADNHPMRKRPERGLLFCAGAKTNRAALHKNDRMMAILPGDGCRESGHVPRFGPARHQFETCSRQVMA